MFVFQVMPCSSLILCPSTLPLAMHAEKKKKRKGIERAASIRFRKLVAILETDGKEKLLGVCRVVNT